MTRAVVMGLGSFGGGLGVTRHLVRRGHDVTVTDLRMAEGLSESLRGLAGLELRTVLGRHDRADFLRADLVVANPAVRPDHPLLSAARESGARVTSEMELFLEEVRARVVCVTGTQGKSSTCHILARLVEGCGRRVHLGGNIGGSLFDTLEQIGPEDVVVLELSSYQLEALPDPERVAAVEGVCVTNVLADHLERHGSVAAYAAAKRRILDLLADDGVAVLPHRDDATRGWRPARGRVLTRAAQDRDADLHVAGGAFRLHGERLAPVSALRVPGGFQVENALSALGLARLLGAEPEELATALPSIGGLAHRMESLGTCAGRHVVDNGVSTTPDSTVSGLLSLSAGVHLIVGGKKKNLPWDELVALCAQRCARVVCFGEAGPELVRLLEPAGVEAVLVGTVEEALREALRGAPHGAEILFSPACASFDAYPNFRARAEAFRAALRAERGPAA